MFACGALIVCLISTPGNEAGTVLWRDIPVFYFLDATLVLLVQTVLEI